MTRIREGDLLWTPSAERKAQANITRYMAWLRESRGLHFASYDDLWRWSVDDMEGFWGSVWDYFDVKAHKPHERVLADRRMPGAKWFPGAEINYAEHALARRGGHTALVYRNEDGSGGEMRYDELSRAVASVAAGLRRLGLKRGDRVAAYLPNIPEAVIALLATASIGAIWSSCSPDFGERSVVDRFLQIEPTVLITVDGYRYGGRDFDRTAVSEEIRRNLPELKATIVVENLGGRPLLEGAVRWEELLGEDAPLVFEPVPFDHPLWVLYSSGTTGLPKAVVQSHGGILLEHLKTLTFHFDLSEDDRFFWFSTTGWMMWNLLVGGLLVGATCVFYDGSPGHKDMNALWRLAQDTGITYFGTSAPYIAACMKAGVEPGRDFDLRALRGIGSTASPLPPESFGWVYEHVKRDVVLGSASGGTDICTAQAGPCPLLPVHAGELQCRMLGVALESYDESGHPGVGRVGELVVTAPMPSMPIFLWGDADGSKHRESYFAMYPGIWRHGDWVKVTERGSCVIYGRSDSTLNRGGVRMGTSEFYSVVEEFPDVADSLVVDTSALGAEGQLLLFLVMREGITLDEALTTQMKERIRAALSPRHVPNQIYAAPAVPKTLNGKKVEVPVKRVLQGASPEDVSASASMANPEAMAYFVGLAGELGSESPVRRRRDVSSA